MFSSNGVINVDYRDLFFQFRQALAENTTLSAPEVTKKIDAFFRDRFSRYAVMSKFANREFLFDIYVATRNPGDLSEGDGKFLPIMAVESELGGEGGGSQGTLEKNVVYDFAKLLVSASQYKILIFTSLPYQNDKDHVKIRVGKLKSIYESSHSPGSILLIHLEAEPKKTASGNSTNPAIKLTQDSITGFVFWPGQSTQTLE